MIPGLVPVLRPFLQYFSHIRTKGENERHCVMKHRLG